MIPPVGATLVVALVSVGATLVVALRICCGGVDQGSHKGCPYRIGLAVSNQALVPAVVRVLRNSRLLAVLARRSRTRSVALPLPLSESMPIMRRRRTTWRRASSE